MSEETHAAAVEVAKALEHVWSVKEHSGPATGFVQDAARNHLANAIVGLVDAIQKKEPA